MMTTKSKKIERILIVLLAFVAVLCITCSAAAAAVTVTADTTGLTGKTGDTVRVPVMITDMPEVGAYQLIVGIKDDDTAKIEVDTTTLRGASSDKNGVIMYSESADLDGTKPLFELLVTPKTADDVTIELSNVRVYNPSLTNAGAVAVSSVLTVKNGEDCIDYSSFLFGLNLSVVDTAVNQTLYAPDRVIVKYQVSSNVNSNSNIAGILTSSVKNSYTPAEILADFSDFIPGLQVVQLPDGVSVEEAIDYYQTVPGVIYAEPDYYYSISAVPNDPGYDSLWGLKRTGANGGAMAEPAWDITTGNDSVIVAVLDTGVDITHPDLKDHIWTNPGDSTFDGVDNDKNGLIDDVHGWNFIVSSSNVMDYNHHGSHCAGTIGAVANNGYGVAGTAWNVTIMPVSVLSPEGSGSSSKIIAGILYAVNESADILSMSLGGSGSPSSAYQDAINYAESHNVLIVAAAGNEANDNDDNPSYPASFENDNVLAVAATNQDNKLAWFSNYGATTVDLAAPGTDINSTTPGVTKDSPVISLVSDMAESGDAWKHTIYYGYDIVYQYGKNTSFLYYNQPVSPQGMMKGNCTLLYNLSNSNGIVAYLISNKPFTSYLSVYEAIYDDDNCSVLCCDYDSDSGEFVVWNPIWVDTDTLQQAIGDGPYYIGIGYQSSSNSDYVYLLDFVYEGYQVTSHEFTFLSGTSMATPMVAGAAALIKSMNQSLTPTEIKSYLMDNVDVVWDLTGKMVSNGRLNLTKAVMAARPEYTVTFETNGGSAVPVQKVLYKDTVVEPADPEKSGYVFEGWYADAGFETPWDFAANKITSPVTIYAKWYVNETNLLWKIVPDQSTGISWDADKGKWMIPSGQKDIVLGVYLNTTEMNNSIPVSYGAYNFTYLADFHNESVLSDSVNLTFVDKDDWNLHTITTNLSTLSPFGYYLYAHKTDVDTPSAQRYLNKSDGMVFIGNITIDAESMANRGLHAPYTIILNKSDATRDEGFVVKYNGRYATIKEDYTFSFYVVSPLELVDVTYNDGRYNYTQELNAAWVDQPVFYIYKDIYEGAFADTGSFTLHTISDDPCVNGYFWNTTQAKPWFDFEAEKTTDGHNLTNKIKKTFQVTYGVKKNISFGIGVNDPLELLADSVRNSSVIVETWMQSVTNNTNVAGGWYFDTPYTVTYIVRPGPYGFNNTAVPGVEKTSATWDSGYKVANLSNFNVTEEAEVTWKFGIVENKNGNIYNNYTGSDKFAGLQVLNSTQNIEVVSSDSYVGENVTFTLTGWKLADVNKNGKVNLQDAGNIAFLAIAGAEHSGSYDYAKTAYTDATYEHCIIADCNQQGGDGVIDAADVKALNNWLTGSASWVPETR